MSVKAPGRGRPGGPWRAPLLLLVVALLCPAVGRAAQDSRSVPEQEEPWPPAMVQALRSFFERVDVQDTTAGLAPPRIDDRGLRPEALAADLEPGVHGAWATVRHGLELVPYVGSLRGAEGVLAAGGGNSLDRALLLARLYRQAGRRVRLVRGRLGWERAASLLGVPERGAAIDPWLRWMETVADHWWLEVRDDGAWMTVDPTAAERPGETPGRSGTALEAVPDELMAVADVALVRAGRELLTVRLPVAELLARGVDVGAERRLPGDEEDPEAPEDGDRDAVPGRQERAAEEVGTPVTPEDAGPDERADPVGSRLPRIGPGPVVLTLEAGDRVLRTDPVPRPELPQISLRARLRLPMADDLEIEIPFGSRPDARIALAFGAGPVASARLSRAVAPLYGSLAELARVELAALEAFRQRPRPGDEEARVEGPVAEEEAEDAEERLHPAEELHLRTALTWLEFDRLAPRALALALLSGADHLAAGPWIERTGVRVVGVHWQPPAIESAGRITVWVRDPVVFTAAPERIPRLQAANGLLQAAMWGQVLNGIADGAPITAFDVTLRSVGTGRRLTWWEPGPGALPDWPGEARSHAEAALGSGYLVAGPREPVLEAGRPMLGWWQVPPRLGLARGWVDTPRGVAQATVPFGQGRSLESLDTLLASVPELHGAVRWLVRAADPESDTLEALRRGICAATSLVGDLMDAGAPPGWPGADFATFCAGPRRP